MTLNGETFMHMFLDDIFLGGGLYGSKVWDIL